MPKQPPPADQVRAVQRILGMPETGRFCRQTIIAAAKFTKSWHRGASLIPLVFQAAQTTSPLPPAATAADTSSE